MVGRYSKLNNMSEKEIIEIIEKLLCEYKEQQNDKKYNDYTVFKATEYSKGLQGLLDLYNKEKETSHFLQSQLDETNAKIIEEKEKNKELEKYDYRKKMKMVIVDYNDFIEEGE